MILYGHIWPIKIRISNYQDYPEYYQDYPNHDETSRLGLGSPILTFPSQDDDPIMEHNGLEAIAAIATC